MATARDRTTIGPGIDGSFDGTPKGWCAMYEIKPVIMKRDKITSDQADKLIERAKRDMHKRLKAGEMPFDICEEWFGLEPDYIDDLMY